MSVIIKAEKVYFTYSPYGRVKDHCEKWVLNDINFSIEEGELIVIGGSNGSGKSTLLRLIDLLFLPTRGHIYLFDEDISLIKDPYKVRSKIGFVFQNPKQQIITNTVLEEIVFGPENLGLKKSEIEKRLDQSIEATGIENLIDRRTDELSGGQKQLVAIASVLAMEPQILLFDEPTSMLHPEYHDRIIGIIKNLHKNGKTIILVSHNSDDFIIGNRCFVMKEGSLIYDSDPKNLFKNYKDIVEKSGLESPASVRISRNIKEKIEEFSICTSLEELSENITAFKRIN